MLCIIVMLTSRHMWSQTIVESARTLWSRVCAIGRRFAGDAMMQASSGMDTAMHTMRNAQEVLTKLGADAWPALSRTGNSLRQSLAIWVTQVAGRDMASALATYLNCVWQRVQACISHLDADLECAKGEPLRAPLWLLGACMLILATYMALSKRTWAVSTAQATFMQKEDATSSAQLPCQPLATPCCDHVESDRRPATPSTPCTPEMPSQQPKCAVTPEVFSYGCHQSLNSCTCAGQASNCLYQQGAKSHALLSCRFTERNFGSSMRAASTLNPRLIGSGTCLPPVEMTLWILFLQLG